MRGRGCIGLLLLFALLAACDTTTREARRLVRVQSSGFESVDMSRLPAGAYMLRVTLEDGKVFSDKVVKE